MKNLIKMNIEQLKSATLEELKQVIDLMIAETNNLPFEKRQAAIQLQGKVIDLYTMKRFGKKL